MTEEQAWKLYNFINDWKNGEYGEIPLSEALDKHYDDGWIRVEEKLPPRIVYVSDNGEERVTDLSEKVLAVVRSGNHKGIIDTTYDYLFGKWCIEIDHDKAKVTHWMPLPGMPKKNYRERYKRISESEWFKKHYEDKSLGETIEEAD